MIDKWKRDRVAALVTKLRGKATPQQLAAVLTAMSELDCTWYDHDLEDFVDILKERR